MQRNIRLFVIISEVSEEKLNNPIKSFTMNFLYKYFK